MTDQPTRSITATPDELQDGRFVAEDVIGTGGMAVVLRAEDTLLGRTVAVKLLSDTLAFDPDARERFSREARAMAGLNHPNIVQVYDVGEVDERPYFIMEHVPGGSLADRLERAGPLPPDEVERIAIGSLRGLAQAHAAGVLHRDLKPANLLVGGDGTTKVTDFGVARAAESESLTQTGIVLGTMRYLAPERLRGQGSTETSDLYGLAATLLELLTAAGIDPKRDARPLRRLPRATPAGLRVFLERTLAEDPEARPGSAEEALRIWQRDPTRPLTMPATDDLGWQGDPDAPTAAHPTATPTGVAARTGPAPWYRRPSHRAWGWIAATTAIVALLSALSAVTGTPTGADDAPPDEPPPTSVEDGIPPGETPLETARNTAEWLRGIGGSES